MDRYRLTTENNPFNPFTEWDEWYFFDISQGYNTCERIAMRNFISDQLPDEINNDETEAVLDELIEVGAIGNDGLLVAYKKVLNPNYKAENIN